MSETELPCPGCGRPMARVGGPDAHRGWTCVSCNAAGDPEEDHLEDPADSRPCGCEEAEALKAERDTFRDMARARGDLLVSAVERQLLAERQIAAVFGQHPYIAFTAQCWWLLVEAKRPRNARGEATASQYTQAQKDWREQTEGWPRITVTSGADAIAQIRGLTGYTSGLPSSLGPTPVGSS